MTPTLKELPPLGAAIYRCGYEMYLHSPDGPRAGGERFLDKYFRDSLTVEKLPDDKNKKTRYDQ